MSYGLSVPKRQGIPHSVPVRTHDDEVRRPPFVRGEEGGTVYVQSHVPRGGGVGGGERERERENERDRVFYFLNPSLIPF